jgi:putative DNA primase/helicase
MVLFVQRLFGYCLTGLTTEPVYPILWGKGRNGKGVLIETFASVLGGYAGPVEAEIVLKQKMTRNSGGPTSDIMALRGKRLVWSSEIEEGRRLDAAKVKWLTGNDSLTGRPMYGKNQIDFRPTHKLILLTNHKPHSSSDDLALWERIHLIEFPLSFVDNPKAKNERKADKNLLEKLKAERPGILAWLVRGCLGWQKEELNPPETVLLATNNYRDEENKISQFINEQCVQSPDEKVTAGDLYRVYGWWANDKGLPLMSIRKFGLEMQNRFRSEKGRHTIYFGIRLKGVPLIPKKEDA